MTTICLIVLALTVPAGQSADVHVGFALEVRGTWRLGTTTESEIKPGLPLPPNTIVSPAGPAPSDGFKLVVVKYDGTLLPPITSKQTLPPRQETSALERIWAVLRNNYRPQIINALSRGVALPDAVLERAGSDLRLDPLLAALPRDAGAVQLRPLQADGSAAGEPLPIVRLSGPSRTVAVPGLRSGLFELTVLRDASDPEPLASAWVRVCDGRACDRQRTAFARIQETTGAWGDSVRATTKRAALRAMLAGLDDAEY